MKLTQSQCNKWALAVERKLHGSTKVRIKELEVIIADQQVKLANFELYKKKMSLDAEKQKQKIIDDQWQAVRKSLEKELKVDDLSHYGVDEDSLELVKLE